MLALSKCFRVFKPDANIVEDIAKLAATEREVRTLETLIQSLAALEEQDGEHLRRVEQLLLVVHQSSSLTKT
jgi:hypothetical protein